MSEVDNKPIKNLAIIVNHSKNGSQALADKLLTLLEAIGINAKSTFEHPVPEDFLVGMDACCVVGGDGTILGVVKQSVDLCVPVFGINIGKLGFLSTFSPEEAKKGFAELQKGNYRIAERTMVQCCNVHGETYFALNDVVIKSYSSRMIQLEVYANNSFVNEYFCDGLIFSTPTGSTAYNLSAGGPIIHPDARVFAMTPICPHTLSNRGVIIDENTNIEVKLRIKNNESRVTLDSISRFSEGDFPLTIKVAKKTFPLILSKDHAHFLMVRQKLKWGGEFNKEG